MGKIDRLKLPKTSKPYKSFYWSRYYEEDTGFVTWKLTSRAGSTQVAGISTVCCITEDRSYMAWQVKKARRELREFIKS